MKRMNSIDDLLQWIGVVDEFDSDLEEGTEITRREKLEGGWIVPFTGRKVFVDKYLDGTYALNVWRLGKIVERGTRTTDMQQLLAEFLALKMSGTIEKLRGED